eukprot:CAMPEP_0174738204 /NCGR_PEP_ID=MMETSP1094-20130205/69578_1 /TAXON_ID=156173 /ORGANISM="Chrysochromulina brevifilum, Strain UTEX LB 985" /LENGTH=35 /DNA_ID= /DNA_START= /DNA_END= /DNA_ORIENTATION=
MKGVAPMGEREFAAKRSHPSDLQTIYTQTYAQVLF